MKFLLASISSVVLASCAGSNQAPREPVGPKGSGYGSIPWNDPSQGGNPGGVLGQMMEGR